jgi:hypothetical protein
VVCAVVVVVVLFVVFVSLFPICCIGNISVYILGHFIAGYPPRHHTAGGVGIVSAFTVRRSLDSG